MLPTQSEYALAPWRRRILWVAFVGQGALLAFWLATWNATWHAQRDVAMAFLYLALPFTSGAALLPRRFIALRYVLQGLAGALLVLSFVTR